MRIDYKNINMALKNICVHDAVFNGFCYDYSNNRVSFCVIEQLRKKRIYFHLTNVIGFNMQSCDFWGKSPHIYDLEIVKDYNTSLLKRIIDLRDSENYVTARIDDPSKFMELKFILTSGDTFEIVFEHLKVREELFTDDIRAMKQ